MLACKSALNNCTICIILQISMSGAGEPLLLAQRMMMEVDEWYEKQVQLMEQLTAKTGMPFTQEIGQRNYGPPPDFQGPPAKGILK
jgi:hypothetical protein